MEKFLIMKNQILTTLCLAFAANVAFAQKTPSGKIHFSSANASYCMSIPKEYTYNHKPLLSFRNSVDDYGNVSSQVNIYDENIDLIKSFNVQDDKKFYYTLTYNVQKRNVKNVNKNEDKRSIGNYESIDQWIEEQSHYNNFDRSSLIIKNQENGDKIISIDYTNNPYGQTNDRMYYAYSYFGLQYPLRYWIWSNGVMYQCDANYSVEYTDWVNDGTTNKDKSIDLEHLYLCNVNLDNGGDFGGGENYFEVSQTLFNEDEDFEYIIPKCALSSNNPGGNMGSFDPGNVGYGERIITEQESLAEGKNNVVMVGFQVVSSNGNIVKNLDFGNGFEATIDDYCAALITIGGNKYLAFNGYCNGKESTIFYKIDNTSSSIKQMKITPTTMQINPAIVNKNSIINISLGDDNSKGSDIVVVSMSGNKVKSVSVPQNQKEVQIPVNVNSGVYCVSRIQQGKVNETKKIIVK